MDAKIVKIGKVTLINGNLHVNYGNPGHQVVVIVPQELQSKVEVRVKPILSHLGDMTLNSKRITKRSEVIEGPEWFSFLEKIKLKQIRVVANIDFVDPLKEDNPGLIGKGARQSEGAAPHNELYDFKAKATL